MNVTLQAVEYRTGERITVIKPDRIDSILFNAIPDLKRENGYFYSHEKIGDCIADLIFEDELNRQSGRSQSLGRITVIQNGMSIKLKFHSPSELLKLLLSKEQGKTTKYIIHVKEEKGMEDYQYHLECPPFDYVDRDYRNEKSTLRRYCHPIDEKIIGVLDNPAVNAVFRTVEDFGADSSFGQMMASGIPGTFNNYPDEDAIIRDWSERLGIRRPYAIISSQLPGINAMTVGSDDEPYLVLSSLLVKTMSREQLKFVIGHECGHIAMGHVVYHSAVATAGNMSQLIPVIGPFVYKLVSFPLNAWERRSEITADRAGLLCCENLELAQRTLLQLESVYQNADALDIDTYITNSKRYLKKGTIRRLGEYSANHPLISKRMEALSKFANSQCYLELTNQSVTPDALTDQQLEKATESIISVL